MDQTKLKHLIGLHAKWLACEVGGERANLSGADLSGADLSGANLRSANLRSADLRSADLSGANLRSADLSGADLSGANLRSANLSGANLRSADLSGANLRSANLRSADLSGSKGVHSSAAWIRENLKTTKRGCVLAFKAIGGTSYTPRAEWKIEPGEYLTETVNPERGSDCACGVNVGTLAFVTNAYPGAVAIWLVGIEPADLCDVVVPFCGNGKFRAGRVRLIRELTPGERSGLESVNFKKLKA